MHPHDAPEVTSAVVGAARVWRVVHAAVVGRPDRRIVRCLASREVVDVAGPHESECLSAIQSLAAGLGDLEPGARVEERVGEVHLHVTECVHDIGEGGEVQVDEVIDRNAEIALDGCYELFRPFDKRRVDLVGTGTRREWEGRFAKSRA